MTYANITKKIQAYQTTDGKLFLTWDEATQHQENLVITKKMNALKLSVHTQLEKAYLNKETVNIIFDVLFNGNWLGKELTSLGFVLKEIEEYKPRSGPGLPLQPSIYTCDKD